MRRRNLTPELWIMRCLPALPPCGALPQAVKGIDFSKVKAVCIGRQTKAAADELGMETYMAEQATMDSVVSCVEKLCP